MAIQMQVEYTEFPPSRLKAKFTIPYLKIVCNSITQGVRFDNRLPEKGLEKRIMKRE